MQKISCIKNEQKYSIKSIELHIKVYANVQNLNIHY